MAVPSAAFAGRGSKLQFLSGSTYTTIAELKTIQFSGLKYDLADVSNMDGGNFREWLPTLADSGEISFNGNLIPGDASQTSLINLFNTAALTAWKVVLPSALGTFSFNAYVSGIDRDLTVDKEGTISGKLKITGAISFA